jgi:hypothetical protein
MHVESYFAILKMFMNACWRLYTYQATGPYMGEINHYLLFERVLNFNPKPKLLECMLNAFMHLQL